jgi:exosome complex component RRP46
MIFTSTILTVSPSGEIIPDPSNKDIKMATSIHVFTFSSKGDLLLSESEGDFDFDTWDRVFELAESICHGDHRYQIGNNGDVNMADNGTIQSLENFVREVIGDKIRHDNGWKLAET